MRERFAVVVFYETSLDLSPLNMFMFELQLNSAYERR